LVGLADFWLLKIIRNTRKALLLAELRNITSQKKLPITPAKPQAATQAITPSLRPRPSYPLWDMLERTYFGSCNFESNIQVKETASEVCNCLERVWTLRLIK